MILITTAPRLLGLAAYGMGALALPALTSAATYTPYPSGWTPTRAEIVGSERPADSDPAMDHRRFPADAVAVSSDVARPLGARGGDRVDVRDFGASCDGDPSHDDTVAFNAAFGAARMHLNGAEILIPSGTCEFSGALSWTVPSNEMIRLAGAGSLNTLLAFNGAGDGIDAILASPTSGFHVRDLTIQRQPTAPAVASTGLSVTAAAHVVNQGVVIRDVLVQGSAFLSGWSQGIYLSNIGEPVIDAVTVGQAGNPDLDPSTGVGITVTGTPDQYSVDAKIVNTTVKGGHTGLLINGSVQGLYVSNSDFIALDYGVYAVSSPDSGTVAVQVTNSHLNAARRSVYLEGMVSVLISNNLFLRYNPGKSPNDYAQVEFNHVLSANVTGNQGAAASTGTEIAMLLEHSSLINITGNLFQRFNTLCVKDDKNSYNNSVVANNCNGGGGYSVIGINSQLGPNLFTSAAGAAPDETLDASGNWNIAHPLVVNGNITTKDDIRVPDLHRVCWPAVGDTFACITHRLTAGKWDFSVNGVNVASIGDDGTMVLKGGLTQYGKP